MSMRQLILFCLMFLLAACQSESRYRIVAQEQKLIDDQNCLIYQRYPVIRGIEDSMTAIGINRYLREGLQLKQQLAPCIDQKGSQRRLVLGDYQAHNLGDSLISIELKREEQFEEQSSVRYFPISLKMPEGFNPPLELLFGEEVFKTIQNHLREWEQADSSRHYNARAYAPGTNYALPYFLTPDSLYLYPGAEGEQSSTQRLAISRTALLK